MKIKAPSNDFFRGFEEKKLETFENFQLPQNAK
jgi:hypothetical protein